MRRAVQIGEEPFGGHRRGAVFVLPDERRDFAPLGLDFIPRKHRMQ